MKYKLNLTLLRKILSIVHGHLPETFLCDIDFVVFIVQGTSVNLHA